MVRTMTAVGAVVRALWKRIAIGRSTREYEARARALLEQWLSLEQLAQFKASRYFDAIGSDTGKRYRIYYDRSVNIDELDDLGWPCASYCLIAERGFPTGDMALAQKIALETNESAALQSANKFPIQNRMLAIPF